MSVLCLSPASLFILMFDEVCQTTYIDSGSRQKLKRQLFWPEIATGILICFETHIPVINGQEILDTFAFGERQWNGNIFRVTGPLCGEFTGHRWIPITKASNAELWCFLCSEPEQTLEQTIETPVIWEAITLTMTSL